MIAQPYAVTFRAHEAPATVPPLRQLGLGPWRPTKLAPAVFRRHLRAASCAVWRRPSDGPHAEMAESVCPRRGPSASQ